MPTPLEEFHQDLETKERRKELFYYHQANAAVNALGARVTEGGSAPRNPCMCSSGAGADRAPPPRTPCTCCSRGRAGSSCAPCCARRFLLPRRPHTLAACRRRCPWHHAPSRAARFSAAVDAAAAALCSVYSTTSIQNCSIFTQYCVPAALRVGCRV